MNANMEAARKRGSVAVAAPQDLVMGFQFRRTDKKNVYWGWGELGVYYTWE